MCRALKLHWAVESRKRRGQDANHTQSHHHTFWNIPCGWRSWLEFTPDPPPQAIAEMCRQSSNKKESISVFDPYRAQFHFFYLWALCVCARVWPVCVCDMYAEVRGQILRVDSVLPPCWCGGLSCWAAYSGILTQRAFQQFSCLYYLSGHHRSAGIIDGSYHIWFYDMVSWDGTLVIRLVKQGWLLPKSSCQYLKFIWKPYQHPVNPGVYPLLPRSSFPGFKN